MDPRTILLVTARADHGGGPEHLLRLGRELKRRRWFVQVAAPQQLPYWTRFSNEFGPENLHAISSRRIDRPSLRTLRRVLRTRPDIAHSHGYGAGALLRPLRLSLPPWGTRYVHTYHGLDLSARNSRMGRLAYTGSERALGRITDAIICVSRGEAEIAENSRLAKVRKIHVIPNGVEIPGRSGMPSVPVDSPSLRVLATIRFNRQKNPDGILDILKLVHRRDGMSFTLVGGSDEERAAFDARIKASNPGRVAVSLVGPVDDVRKLFSQHDVVLSTSRWEGMPLFLLEAMASGLPVVASDVVGNRDILFDSKAGTLYDLAHPAAAVAALRRLRDIRERMTASELARELIEERHSLSQMVDETERVYDDLGARP